MQHETSCWLQKHFGIKQLKVVPDFELVLAAAFPNREGIAVISGTGSVAHGIRGAQQTRVGGWGYLVDDHGSGYWFGRAALQAMAQEADGRRTNATISDLIHQRFGKTSATEIIASLHDSPDHVAGIASLAPLVFDAALAGDEVADQIIADAATGLAEMIVTAARQLGYADSDVSLAAAGGVFAGAPVLGERLLAALKDQAIYPARFDIVREPVRGALRLASS
jgi:N-acetylglucosamine kinase-like BadF-type ATPase